MEERRASRGPAPQLQVPKPEDLIRRPKAGELTVVFALVLYFGLLLVPEWWPGYGATLAYFMYLLTLPLALLALLGLAGVGAFDLFTSRRGSYLSMLRVSVAGLLLFGAAYGVSAAIRGPLPSGSRLKTFDSAQWKQEGASGAIGRDISVRQKMLGDVVTRVLPGRDRQALEQVLGPSLETPYFEQTGRHLIYLLGRERESMFAIDSEWLLIWLDGSGRFVRYEVRTD